MQANNFTAVKVVLGGAVATNGTFTVPYPSDKTLGEFENAVGHYFTGLGTKYTQPDDFTIAFGATSATITYKGATTLPQGAELYVQLEEPGEAVEYFGYVADGTLKKKITQLRKLQLLQIDLGAPAAIDDNGVCESQNRSGAGALTINGALASGGVATLDVPRNVIADSGGADTAVITVTGTDQYGQVVKENITLNGTTAVAGKKAFKTITAVASDATISNGFFLGTGDVLGLPVYLPSGGYVHAELQDGAAVGSAGTLVAGLAANTISTATTADVRGTYDPNAACDGGKSFALVVTLPDPSYLGNDQYDG